MEIVSIPPEGVSSRKYIEWQSRGATGIELRDLANLCGCLSDEQRHDGCHHPASKEHLCSAQACPLATPVADQPPVSHADETLMVLVDDGSNFGHGGVIRARPDVDVRSADMIVRRLLAGEPPFAALPPETPLVLLFSNGEEKKHLTYAELLVEYAADLDEHQIRHLQEDMVDYPFGFYPIGGQNCPQAHVALA